MFQSLTKGMACILAFILLGCVVPFQPKPMPCDSLIDPPLRQFDFDHFDQDRLVLWVMENYQLPRNEIRVAALIPEEDPLTESITWITLGKTYHADFAQTKLIKLQVHWEEATPTAANVIQCLGTPVSYLAYYVVLAKPILDLQLWYPDQGVIVRSILPQRTPPDRLDESLRLHYAILTRPGPPQAMIHDFHTRSSLQEVKQRLLELLKPWPGMWEETVIEISPEFQP